MGVERPVGGAVEPGDHLQACKACCAHGCIGNLPVEEIGNRLDVAPGKDDHDKGGAGCLGCLQMGSVPLGHMHAERRGGGLCLGWGAPEQAEQGEQAAAERSHLQ